jgi:hypothetical protein
MGYGWEYDVIMMMSSSHMKLAQLRSLSSQLKCDEHFST